MDFYFIRHGQSQNNLLWEQSGSNDGRVVDPLLTEAGEQQAELLAAFLAASGIRITHLYCSLMERAIATGYRVAEALDLPLHGWLDIHETGGMFLYDKETETYIPKPGRTRSYLAATYPRLVLPDEVTEDGWWNRPFEPKELRAPRARRVLAQLLASHKSGSDDGVAIVSHGGFFNYIMRAITGLPERDPEEEHDPVWFAANNASIMAITFAEDQRVIRYLNRVDFLPTDLIT